MIIYDGISGVSNFWMKQTLWTKASRVGSDPWSLEEILPQYYGHVFVSSSSAPAGKQKACSSRGDQHVRSTATSLQVLPKLCLAPDKNIASFPAEWERRQQWSLFWGLTTQRSGITEFHHIIPGGKGTTQAETRRGKKWPSLPQPL